MAHCVNVATSFNFLHIPYPLSSLAVYLDHAACTHSRDWHMTVWHIKYGSEDTKRDCFIATIPT